MFDERNLKHKLSVLLTDLRHKNQKSVRQTALEAGLNPKTLGIIETGTIVNWRHYYKLLRYYNCDVEVRLIAKRPE